MTEPTNYPLSWPEGWKRTLARDRKPPRFESGGRPIGIPDACDRIYSEIEGGSHTGDDLCAAADRLEELLREGTAPQLLAECKRLPRHGPLPPGVSRSPRRTRGREESRNARDQRHSRPRLGVLDIARLAAMEGVFQGAGMLMVDTRRRVE